MFFSLIVYGSGLYGFISLSGRGEGLCRSYSGLALGYEACGWNPATLALAPQYSFNIATIGLEYNSNLSFSDYTRIMEGMHFTDEDKRMFSLGEELNFFGNAQAVSLSYKNFGLMTYAYSHQYLNIPEDITSLIFWGNELDKEYSFKNIDAKSDIGFEVILSGAYALGGLNKHFSFGGSLKYIQGISYMDICESDGKLTTTFYSTDEPKISGWGEIISRSAEGGRGLGADIGVLYTFGRYFVSLSAMDVFSEVTWDIRPKKTVASFKLDPVDLETFDPDTNLIWETNEYTETFTTFLDPNVDLNIGLKKEYFSVVVGCGYPRIFSLGAESHYRFLVFRSGVSIEDNRPWGSFGIGVIKNLFHLDIGIRMNSSSHISAGFSAYIIPNNPW